MGNMNIKFEKLKLAIFMEGGIFFFCNYTLKYNKMHQEISISVFTTHENKITTWQEHVAWSTFFDFPMRPKLLQGATS
jgi:hypothetical protein